MNELEYFNYPDSPCCLIIMTKRSINLSTNHHTYVSRVLMHFDRMRAYCITITGYAK